MRYLYNSYMEIRNKIGGLLLFKCLLQTYGPYKITSNNKKNIV